MNEIIAIKKDINHETFWNYFKYQHPPFLAKDLIRDNQAKNEQLVNNIYDGFIDLRNTIKSLEFNKQQKGKGNKILIPKQMRQRLPIALAQIKAPNTSVNLLNEIRQIIYFLYQEKEVPKKVYNNIMNSISVKL